MTTVRQENEWLSDTIPSHLCSVADLGEGPRLPYFKTKQIFLRHVNRKWPFFITGQQFFPNIMAIRLSKSKDT